MIPCPFSIRVLLKRENRSDSKVKGTQQLHSNKPWGLKGNVITTEPSHNREIFHKEHINTQSKFRIRRNIIGVKAYKLKGCESIVCKFPLLNKQTYKAFSFVGRESEVGEAKRLNLRANNFCTRV